MNTIRRSIFATIATITLAAVAPATLCGLLVTQTGCPAFIAALPTVGEIVADGVAILGMISQAVAAYFRSNPNPSEQAKIENGITKAQQALITGEQILSGIQNATAGQTAQAFAAFSAAYSELMQLIAPLGIVPAQPVVTTSDAGAVAVAAISPTPRLAVPTPLAVRLVKSNLTIPANK